MSLEQHDYWRSQNEKKKLKLEEEKKNQFWLEKELHRETNSLLHKLASEISKEFWLNLSEVKELIAGDTVNNLENLKNHIGNKSESINVEKLQQIIQKAQESIADLSKKSRETLRKSLEKNMFSPEKHEFSVNKKLFSEETRNRAKNPQSFSDQALWVWLGIIDSTEAIILFTYSLWKWVLFTPYHIYLIITGRAQYDGFSRI